MGLLGGRLGPCLFLTGPELFRHISFLGCAPQIPLTPGESEQFLRIYLPRLKRAQLFAADNARIPVCLHCRTPYTGWRAELKAGKQALRCEHCGEQTASTDLKLGKRACYSQHVVQIAPVFEGEAVPTQILLDALENHFDAPFAYAYTRLQNEES